MPAIRKSKKREAIYALLCASKSHPSAEWIYAQLKPEMPDLSLGTVYRNIAMFKQDGTAITVANVNGLERFDGNTEPHAHFICKSCGKVEDLMEQPLPDYPLVDGVVEDCQLIFHGICSLCKAKQEADLT